MTTKLQRAIAETLEKSEQRAGEGQAPMMSRRWHWRRCVGLMRRASQERTETPECLRLMKLALRAAEATRNADG